MAHLSISCVGNGASNPSNVEGDVAIWPRNSLRGCRGSMYCPQSSRAVHVFVAKGGQLQSHIHCLMV